MNKLCQPLLLLQPAQRLCPPGTVSAAVAVLCLHTAALAHNPSAYAPPTIAASDEGATPTGAHCDANCRNHQVAEHWLLEAGPALPVVTTDGQGQRRLLWRGSLTLKTHTSSVNAGQPGRLNTASRSGPATLAHVRSEFQLPDPDGQASSELQVALQGGNDGVALPEYRTQVQNISAARRGPGYALQLGDHAVNYSQLGLQLGYRGLNAEFELGGVKANVLAGTLAESWEALGKRSTVSGRPARSRYLRDVAGVHVSRDVASHAKVFAALASYRDQGASVEAMQQQAPVMAGQSAALGLQLRQGDFSFSLEWGHNRSAQEPGAATALTTADPNTGFVVDDEANRIARSQGSAISVDAGFRFKTGQLRWGLRRIDALFSAAAPTTQPGAEEAFAGGDWAPTAGLQFNADLRRTGHRSAATALSASQRTQGRRLQLGANATLASWWSWAEGLSLTAQGHHSIQDQTGNEQRQSQNNLGLNWSHRVANLGLSWMQARTLSANHPSGNSHSTGLQASASLPLGAAGSAGWAGQLGLVGGQQRQDLPSQAATLKNRSLGLTLHAKREGVAQVNLAYQHQTSLPPMGGVRLVQQQLQLDAQRPLTPLLDVRASARWARHNQGAADRSGNEHQVSLELLARW